jgi:hypothetical protein
MIYLLEPFAEGSAGVNPFKVFYYIYAHIYNTYINVLYHSENGP